MQARDFPNFPVIPLHLHSRFKQGILWGVKFSILTANPTTNGGQSSLGSDSNVLLVGYPRPDRQDNVERPPIEYWHSNGERELIRKRDFKLVGLGRNGNLGHQGLSTKCIEGGNLSSITNYLTECSIYDRSPDEG